MFFAKSTGGFYLPEIHGENIPLDAVEISIEQHAALMQGQSEGKRIIADENGFPTLADAIAPTDDQLAAEIRAERDSLANTFKWRLERYERQIRLGIRPTDDIAALDTYMQALADITKQPTFPLSVDWPVAP